MYIYVYIFLVVAMVRSMCLLILILLCFTVSVRSKNSDRIRKRVKRKVSSKFLELFLASITFSSPLEAVIQLTQSSIFFFFFNNNYYGSLLLIILYIHCVFLDIWKPNILICWTSNTERASNTIQQIMYSRQARYLNIHENTTLSDLPASSPARARWVYGTWAEVTPESLR